jgi:hypothetical protein
MSKLTVLIGFLFLAVSSAWAQTPAPTTPAPGATPGSPPAGDAAATGGGLADYWWIILLVIIVATVVHRSTGSRTQPHSMAFV